MWDSGYQIAPAAGRSPRRGLREIRVPAPGSGYCAGQGDGMRIHQLDPQDVGARLRSGPGGLSSAEARARLAEYG
ncbi:MAG: cation-transporting P-type ATPase, partial [Gammaproteobacteria bacterium]